MHLQDLFMVVVAHEQLGLNILNFFLSLAVIFGSTQCSPLAQIDSHKEWHIKVIEVHGYQ